MQQHLFGCWRCLCTCVRLQDRFFWSWITCHVDVGRRQLSCAVATFSPTLAFTVRTQTQLLSYEASNTALNVVYCDKLASVYPVWFYSLTFTAIVGWRWVIYSLISETKKLARANSGLANSLTLAETYAYRSWSTGAEPGVGCQFRPAHQTLRRRSRSPLSHSPVEPERQPLGPLRLCVLRCQPSFTKVFAKFS